MWKICVLALVLAMPANAAVYTINIEGAASGKYFSETTVDNVVDSTEILYDATPFVANITFESQDGASGPITSSYRATSISFTNFANVSVGTNLINYNYVIGGQKDLFQISLGQDNGGGHSGINYYSSLEFNLLGTSQGTGNLDSFVGAPLDFNSSSGTLFYSFNDSGIYGPGRNAFLSLALAVTRFSASTVSAVPEPSTWALMVIGFGGIGCSLRRRRLHAASEKPVTA